MYSAEWQATQLVFAFANPGSVLERNCALSAGSVIVFSAAHEAPPAINIADAARTIALHFMMRLF
jgi:hypothetical protein